MGTILTRQAPRLPAWSVRDWAQETGLRWSRMWRLIAAELNQTVERARQRRALARLDNRMLQDLGLRSEHVHTELRKWFWQI